MIDIKSLKNGSTIDELFLIHDAFVAKTKAGKDYLRCTLGNKTGTIEARLWTLPAKYVLPKVGELFRVWGTVTEFNSTLQINVDTMQPVSPDGDTDITEFTASVDNPPGDTAREVAYALIEEAIAGSNVLSEIWNRFKRSVLFEKSSTWTAACAVHHAGAYGWIKHSFEVLKYALQIYRALPADTKPHVRYDVLMLGAFFHDIGKLRGYGFECGVSVMTDEGMLLEHAVLGCLIIEDLLNGKYTKDAPYQLSTEEEVSTVIALEHCIASHHMELEWGAPVNPVAIEAVIIAHADQLSASLDTITQSLNKRAADDKWSEKIFTQHNRKFTTFNK